MVHHFSIIVPTYNRTDSLYRCVQALADLDYPRAAYEVIVVDDGGSNSIRSLLEPWCSRLQLRLLEQENAGPSSSRNHGASEAGGDWLVFLDDDCIPGRGWLRAFAEAATDANELLGGVSVNGSPANPYSVASELLLEYVVDYFAKCASPLRFFPSNNIAVAADRFKKVGGFDRIFRLAAGEDREFCYRWMQTGGRLRKVPDAVVQHAQSLNLMSFFQQHFRYGEGAFTFRSIRGRRNAPPLRLEPASFYSGLIRFPLRSGRGSNAWFCAALAALSQFASAAGFLWESRLAVPTGANLSFQSLSRKRPKGSYRNENGSSL
jgi:GT2 family glycosyltransferase